MIQERLQSYQKSDSGYQLGLKLLSHQDKNVRYFGALTITVFLNTHDSGDIYTTTFDQILEIIVFLINEDFAGNSFIIKKLLSNLSLLFVSNCASSIIDPVERLSAVILLTDNNPLPTSIIDRLHDQKQLEIVIQFLTILVEDIIKVPKLSPSLHNLIHSTIFNHCRQLYEQIGYQVSLHIHNQMLDCLSSWVVYISVAETLSDQRYTDDMGIFIQYLLNQFSLQEGELNLESLNKVFTVMTEIIDHIPRVLTPFKSTIFLLLFANNSFGVNFIKQSSMTQILEKCIPWR